MHGKIDIAREERALNLLRENSLRAKIDDRLMTLRIARCGYFDDFHVESELHERVARPRRLPHCQRAGTRS